MLKPAKLAIAGAIFSLGISSAWAQGQGEDYRHPRATELQTATEQESSSSNDRPVSILAAALDANVANAETDCSHLVHTIYEEAGLPYRYAPSSDIYAGIDGFQRVKSPKAGDLVVWRGHVGIVIKPARHIFFSYLREGPGTDDYESPYWKHRGHPRFYRYAN